MIVVDQYRVAPPTYRHLRLSLLTPGIDLYELYEVEWMVGAMGYPTANMTGASAPSPLVASASSANGSYPAWRAFDGSLATRGWVSAAGGTQHLTIDLGAGNGIAPTGVRMAPYDAGYMRYPTAFEAQGSNDGSSWTTLYAASGLTTGWTHQTFRDFTF